MLLSPSQHPRFLAVDRFRRKPAIVARRILCFAFTATAPSSSGVPAPICTASHSVHLTQSSSSSVDVTLGCRRDPELGLAYVAFVISMVFGCIFSLLVISLPALHAFRKLGASTAKLSKVVSEDVSGTLFSLKLSGLETNDLTRQLNDLILRISGGNHVKKERRISRFCWRRSDSATG